MSVLAAVVILASVTIVCTAGAGSVLWITLRGSARETREFVRSTREAILYSSMEFRQLHRVNQQLLMRSERLIRNGQKISEENQRILKDLSIMIGRIDERMDNA